MNLSRLADLSDKAMEKALDGWSRNTNFRDAVDFLQPNAVAKQQMILMAGNFKGENIIKAITTGEEDSVLFPDKAEWVPRVDKQLKRITK